MSRPVSRQFKIKIKRKYLKHAESSAIALVAVMYYDTSILYARLLNLILLL